ncbi:MAG: undecaprenyldiphospho-muramoylpentapeptide beta-N-acetylglucosaminyltransferase [Deltaproteobacteria bacterium]|nr:undecaprenyldiphospho-muramoylpentapeptide beta-N-acetylglucosaminyltransferase [Deltaproteobacteria bacterium]
MNFVIAGGGTGGHLFPGLAVAEKIKEIDPSAGIYFIGTSKGIESKLKDEYGLQLYIINASGFSGKKVMNKIKSFINTFIVFKEVNNIFKEIKPDFVLGLGGYSSFAPVFYAKFKGIRSGVMEQNLEPGLSNKILGYFRITVFASFKETKKYFPFSKFIFSGNPVRKNILNIIPKPPDVSKKELAIFVFGGSQGASSINRAVMNLISSLDADIKREITVFHQTGEKEYDNINYFYSNCGIKHYEVFKFTNNMEKYYELSDIIIARSGAGTVSEIIAIKKPAILIPYPYAAKNHQFKNAYYLLNIKGAYLIKDDENLSKELFQTIEEIFYNRSLLSNIYYSLNKINVQDSALNIANLIVNNN